MMTEMLSDGYAGWLHNHVFKYVEDLWERPLAWVCRLFCGELKMETYKRRVNTTLDQEKEIRDTESNKTRDQCYRDNINDRQKMAQTVV